MNNPRLTIIILVLAGLAALGAGIGSYMAQQTQRQENAPDGLLWPNPKPFPAITLYNQGGGDFSAKDFRDHWSLVFFGFTNCPDICPTTLATLDRLQQRLVEQGVSQDKLQIVFISVDPQRDTPARLKEYVTYFDKDFIGASGDKEAIDKLTRSIGAVYRLGQPDANGDYQVDHSASVFLFGPEARMLSVFTTPHEVEPMAQRFMAIRDFINTRNE